MPQPFSAVSEALQFGLDSTMESDAPVRVAVYVDASATPFLVGCIKEAFVPRTTSALVRVERLGADPVAPKSDTDVVLVLSCGSAHLEDAVQQLVIAGAPVCVLTESSVEAPFIAADTPMLGLISATDKVHLLESLARWILDRTEKDTAFAANFRFMRIAAANRIITSAALTNMATGALVFIPGANYPMMAMTEVGMTLKLASIFGYGLKAERGYEIAFVLGCGLALRALARTLSGQTTYFRFAVKALVAGVGTYGMGYALTTLYDRGVDYGKLNELLRSSFTKARREVGALLRSRTATAPRAATQEG